MTPDVKLLLGPGTSVGDALIVPRFVPLSHCDPLFTEVTNVFALLARERSFRPCVGAVVLRHRGPHEPEVLMGVTASSAFRHGLTPTKRASVPKEKRSGLAHLCTFPKGGMEESDGESARPLETTARRELWEEMRVPKSPLHLVGAVELVVGIEARAEDKARLRERTGYGFGKAHFYLVFGLRPTYKVRRNDREMKAARWVTPSTFESAIEENRKETAAVMRSVYWSALRGYFTLGGVRRSTRA